MIATFTFSAFDARIFCRAAGSRDLALAMGNASILLASHALENQLLSPKWWFEGAHVKVGVLERSWIAVIERSAQPTHDEELAAVFAPVEKAFARIARERYALLIDVRAAPGRNDPEFEKKFEPVRQNLQKGFRRIAILVRSTSGKLQVQRYGRADNLPSGVFDDPAAAVKWLEEVSLRP